MEQIPETLWIEHDVYRLYTAPLAPWLRTRPELAFEARSDACSRGYIGRWQFDGGQLWLIDLHGWIDGRLWRVADLFDGQAEIPAEWFSGQLVFEPSIDSLKEGAMAQMQRVAIQNGRLSAARPGPA